MRSIHASAGKARASARTSDDPPTRDAARALRRKVLAIHAIRWLAIALIMVAPLAMETVR